MKEKAACYIRDRSQHQWALESLSHLDADTIERRERTTVAPFTGITVRSGSMSLKGGVRWWIPITFADSGVFPQNFIRVISCALIQCYANTALCTPAFPLVVCAVPPPPWKISTYSLQSGFILQALCEYAWMQMFAYQCAFVILHKCMCVSCVSARVSVWEWMSNRVCMRRWKQLLALVPCFDVRKEKKKKSKKIRHKWQMAILVALQCCSPLAYIKTSFDFV